MKTPLYDRHVALGAKMIEFSGWEMPLYYKGVISEHFSVRRAVGLFDVSHMGIIEVKGEDAEIFLDFISTNLIVNRPNFSAVYTVLGSENGGSIDDTVIFRIRIDHFLIVTNASNRRVDLEHLQKHSKGYRVAIEPLFETHGILALQGPNARPLLARLLGYEPRLNVMQLTIGEYAGHKLLISRTGYTGSFGYEFMTRSTVLGQLWDELLELGKQEEIQPAGLGARDTLRLEGGYCLYGHELAPDIAPTESVSEWTVRWKKALFLGKAALIRLETNPKKRSQHGVVLLERIPRRGNPVYKQGRLIGIVTSGTHSPCLGKGIAIIMVSETIAFGEKVEIEVRGHRHVGEVVKLPFYKA
jgi:aminomethyltransferase